MDAETIRVYCLSKAGVTEGFPFDNETLVFKVQHKMFALINLEGDLRINLKCDPERAIELRELFSAVVPGYHMNKNHWNTVKIDGTVPKEHIFAWIDHSYALVFRGFPKKLQEELKKR